MGLSIHGPGEGEGQILHVFLLWRSCTSLQHLVLVLPWRGEGTRWTIRTCSRLAILRLSACPMLERQIVIIIQEEK